MSEAPLEAAVVVTGDEVLGGRVAELNAAFIARDLAGRGIELDCTVIVGDSRSRVAGVIADLIGRGTRLICVTGGLGPTPDDLTMQALADATGRQLEVMEDALAMVVERSRSVRRQMHVPDHELEQMRRKQATLPEGADVLAPIGTAPGCVLAEGRSVVVVLPGPPSEAHPMWGAATEHPAVARLLRSAVPDARPILRTWGVVEAELMTALGSLGDDQLQRIGTYTRSGEIEVVVPAELAADVASLIDARFPDALFARDGALVEELVAAALVARDEQLSVAESCTGGGLGGRLTAFPGASAWFLGGVIAYDDAVKRGLLGVASDTLATFGAVSVESAAAMASGVRSATGADWGVSITGVAGPGGGTADKPVGTVCIAVDGPSRSSTRTTFWTRDRESIRVRAQTAALHHLRLALAAS